MALPGFTAETSVYRSPRHYRATGQTARAVADAVTLQQDEEAPGTCCGVHCPGGFCYCHNGHGHCMLPGADNVVLKATDSVTMAVISSCHADREIMDPDGTRHQAFVTCDSERGLCGCYATTHDAACVPCG